MTENDVIRAKLISDSLFFTRYFFKQRFKRKFVVSKHHEIICNALNDVLSGKIKRLAIAIAPRYGKTELAVKNVIAQGLAINPASKFIHLSYSKQLALDNSEEVRDFIQEEEYKRLFPYVKMDKSSTAKNKWYTTEGGGIYATATGGQITGFGAGEVDEVFDDFISEDNNKFAGAIIIDDALKPDDAKSELKRERVNQRFETTIRSRTNSRNTPIIVIGQRLHERDLIGYLMENEPNEWTLITLPCILTNEYGEEEALWEFKQTLEELKKIREADERVFETQYQQNPQSLKGKLIPITEVNFEDTNKYDINDAVYKFAIGDPANTGGDNYSMLFVWVYIVENKLSVVVKDIIYSKNGIESLTDTIKDKLREHFIEDTFLEVNGVGVASYFLLKKEIENHTTIKPFTTTENKEAKILSNFEFIKKYFIFDINYKLNTEHNQFITHLTGYSKEGDNKHKLDAIDNASMVAKVLKTKYKTLLYG